MKIAGRQFSRNSGLCLKYVHQIYAKNLIKCCITVYIMYTLITDTTTSSVKKNFVRFSDAFLVMCAGDVLACICILFARTYPDDFHERIGQQN